MSSRTSKSSRRPSGSKPNTSSHSSSKQSQSEETWPPVSFLFIVNELTTNDDPEVPGSVQARQHDGRWYPPEVAEGFFAQRPGRVYRWSNGRVSQALPAYKWESQPTGYPVYANGTLMFTSAAGTTISLSESYYRSATVFYCNRFAKFYTTKGDVTTGYDHDGWHPLSFFHEGNVSCVDHAGDQEFLAVRTSDWIGQLLPKEYRSEDTHGPSEGGLAGLLPIIVALVAFSCTRENLKTVLIEDRAWRGHKWVPHSKPSGRIPKRGMVVTIFLDPENPQGSTLDTLEALEDGQPKPIFR